MNHNIRNIAIIAHVDHGKTTLVDSLLTQSGLFHENQQVQDRVLDSGDIERERGITILAKNTAIDYKGYKLNIIDTPGHADFGGEVERVLKMASGVVLVVDAFEGVMPQTKVVLRRAFSMHLPLIVCVNKIDRPDARPHEVVDEVLELFIALDADESYADSPFVFTSAKRHMAGHSPEEMGEGMSVFLDQIIETIPAPENSSEGPLQLLISTIDYNDYVGRIGIGRVERGVLHANDQVMIVNHNEPGKQKKVKVTHIYEFSGLDRVETDTARAGSIVAVSGVEGITIGDTLVDPNTPEAVPFVKISEPTLSMVFSVNDSPFAGKDGKYVTSQRLRQRLYKETETDVSMRVEDTSSTDSLKVFGRGELHLSVLIENMRREGYEFQVSKPEVLFREDENGKRLEPIERITLDVEEAYSGAIIEKLGSRKAEMQSIQPYGSGYIRMQFVIPARGLIGYRQELMTDTKGTGVLNSEFEGYEPYKGEIQGRQMGSLIASEAGEATAYGLGAAQNRGVLFIGAGEAVYEGMVVGENPKGLDIEVNVCRRKQQSNVRASGSDEAIRLSPPKEMRLEDLMEFVESDERIEVTPNHFRIRKAILNTGLRHKSLRRK